MNRGPVKTRHEGFRPSYVRIESAGAWPAPMNRSLHPRGGGNRMTNDSNMESTRRDAIRPMEAYFDFDGVFNAFPDPKILRRGGQNHLEWLRNDDPRRELYDPDKNAFLLNDNSVIKIKEGSYRIHWSNELTNHIRLLAGENGLSFHWLTTWQPHTELLDDLLGFSRGINDDYEGSSISTVTEQWYDPDTRRGIWTGKPDTISKRIHKAYGEGESLSLIWVDDEECDCTGLKAIQNALNQHGDDGSVKVLLVRPDEKIGLSRRQFDEILKFVKHSEDYDRLSYDVEPSINDPYDEMNRAHLGF